LLEAMASGLPIIATNIGGIPEAVGDAGILVPPADIEALKSKLILLMNNDSLRIELGLKGRERALKFFRREDVAQKIRMVYRKFLS